MVDHSNVPTQANFNSTISFNHWQRSQRRSGKLEADTASDCHRMHYDLASRYCAKVETREKQLLMAASLHMELGWRAVCRGLWSHSASYFY